ncbi:MAG TPA: universal stress protein [Chloroflexota bacterium]|nr:universal stress protein [Chloroflexota bacterium]
MFRRILVPLDGSPLAEAVLADLFTLAADADPEVLLVGVVAQPAAFAVAEALQETSLRGDVAVDAGGLVPAIERELTAPDRARLLRYLDDRAAHLAAAGLRTRTQVRVGDAATEIVRCARDERADAIAMSTHGRGGLDRALHGSVAEAVLRTAGRPVLLTRPAPEDFARLGALAAAAGSAGPAWRGLA